MNNTQQEGTTPINSFVYSAPRDVPATLSCKGGSGGFLFAYLNPFPTLCGIPVGREYARLILLLLFPGISEFIQFSMGLPGKEGDNKEIHCLQLGEQTHFKWVQHLHKSI